ncbi:hypothetical protein RI367_000881 [Sorochytrium milnesiophthora]
MEMRALYRGLLREVDRQFTKKNNNKTWRQYLRRRFEEGAAGTQTTPQALQLEAENALLFLQSNRKHHELLEFYFPTMREDERVTRTANRVGLQMPRLFDPKGDGGER